MNGEGDDPGFGDFAEMMAQGDKTPPVEHGKLPGNRLVEIPIPMLIYCPMCGKRHIDEGEFATKSHHTHACQKCGNVWRPCLLATVGVAFLPGFKNG